MVRMTSFDADLVRRWFRRVASRDVAHLDYDQRRAAAVVLGAICTDSPSAIESGGLTITLSWPVRPSTTSMRSPKSRPGDTALRAARPFVTVATFHRMRVGLRNRDVHAQLG